MENSGADVDGQNRQWCLILRREANHPIAAHWYRHFRKSFYETDPDVDVCRDRLGRRLD